MALKFRSYLSLLLLSHFGLVLAYGSRLPVSRQQDGSLNFSELERLPIPKSWSTIGSIDSVNYYQESTPMNRTAARANCASVGRTLARFRNKAHLDFVIANGALDSSWTDARIFYSGSMYTPPVDPIIEVVQGYFYKDALAVNTSGRNLFNDYQDGVYPSICQLGFILDRNSHNKVSQNYSETEEPEIKGEMATEQGVISPNAFSFLGIYEGYHYWYQSTYMTLSESRTSCESMGGGFHLATFEKKTHLDFVFSYAVYTGGLWTGHRGIITRNAFKWGDNSLIAMDIPINIDSPVSMLIAERSALVAGYPEHAKFPSICRIRVGREPQ